MQLISVICVLVAVAAASPISRRQRPRYDPNASPFIIFDGTDVEDVVEGSGELEDGGYGDVYGSITILEGEQTDKDVEYKQKPEKTVLYKQDKPEKEVVYKQEKPEKEALYKQEKPEKEVVYKQEKPEKEVVYKQEKPEKEVVYKQEKPEKEVVYKQDKPEKEVVYKQEKPEKEALYKQEKPEKEVVYKQEKPVKEVVYKQEKPEKEVVYKQEKPEKEVVYKQEKPEKEVVYKQEKPEKEVVYKQEKPEKEVVYKQEKPEYRSPVEKTVKTLVQSSVSRGADDHGLINYRSVINNDGSFSYGFETTDPMSQDVQGQAKKIGDKVGMVMQGHYSFVAKDEFGNDVPVDVSWRADENGFVTLRPPTRPDAV